MKFIVYDMTGKELRGVSCPSTQRYLQARDGEFIMKGIANDATQKVKFDGFDENGQPINPRIVNKSQAEINRDNPKTKPIPTKKRRAFITNEQLEGILGRLAKLEGQPPNSK